VTPVPLERAGVFVIPGWFSTKTVENHVSGKPQSSYLQWLEVVCFKIDQPNASDGHAIHDNCHYQEPHFFAITIGSGKRRTRKCEISSGCAALKSNPKSLTFRSKVVHRFRCGASGGIQGWKRHGVAPPAPTSMTPRQGLVQVQCIGLPPALLPLAGAIRIGGMVCIEVSRGGASESAVWLLMVLYWCTG